MPLLLLLPLALLQVDECWNAAQEAEVREDKGGEDGSKDECTPLVKGQWVDAYCLKTNKWYPSKLVAVEEQRAKVHFHGYVVYLCLRIQPVR
jgi:hypothetical protein